MRRLTELLVIILLAIGVAAGLALAKISTAPTTVTVVETLTTTSPTTVTKLSTYNHTKFLTATVTKKFTTTSYQMKVVKITETHVVTTTLEIHEVSSICFSKTADCEDLIISLLNSAEEKIDVMIYSFTLDRLADALINARKRGVEVRVVVEEKNAYQRGSEVEKLKIHGVKVALDANPYLMHHKVAIIDGKIVLTGSYNWSYSAENRNDENLVVIVSKKVASIYEEEFERIWNRSIKL